MVKIKVLKEFFFSQVLGKPILDAQGYRIGRIRDMVVSWDGISPRVTGVKYAKGLQEHIEIKDISHLDENGIVLKGKLAEIKPKILTENEIYVGKWLLDKQIIDLNGSKLVRVNDIKLSWLRHGENYDVILVAVDIGVRGLLRRIGLEWLVKKQEQHFVGWQYIKPLTNRTANLQLSKEQNQVSQLHPADIADIIEELDYKERTDFLGTLDNQTAADALAEVDLDTQVEIISEMESVRASDILEEMPADDAADILGELSIEKSVELLNLMEPEEAEEVRELMGYPEDSAGALMTTEYIAFAGSINVDETINKLRELSPSVETIYYLYVVDGAEKLLGVLSLRDLIVAQPQVKLAEIMSKRVVSVKVDEEHRKVLDVVNKYNLLAVPVIDDEGILLGIITIDNLLETLVPDRGSLGTFSDFIFPKRTKRGWIE